MRDAATTFLIRVGGAALTFGLQVLLARLMAPEAFGAYVVIWTWLLASGSFASLGLAESAVRFLPRYEGRGRNVAAASFFSFGARAAAVAASLAAVLAFACLNLLPIGDSALLMGTVIAAGLPFIALEYYFEGVARALGWFKLTSVVVFIVRPLAISAACALLVFAGRSLTAILVATVLITVLAVSSAFLYVLLRRALPAGKPGAPPRTGFWLRATLPVLVVSGLEDVVATADVLLVGLLLSVADAGQYFVALRILALALLAQYAVQFVQGRRFSLALSAAGQPGIERSLQNASRLTVGVTLITLGASLLAGPLLLSAFGSSFTAAFVPMVILAAGLLARAFAVQAAELLQVGGKYRVLVIANLATILVLVLGMALLVPSLGLTGAAVASALSQLLRAVVVIGGIKTSMGINVVSPFFRPVPTATSSAS